MPTPITHSLAAVVLRGAFDRRTLPAWAPWLGVCLAVLPDADVVGFSYGIRYDDMLGHRGLTHAPLFAAAVATAIVAAIGRRAGPHPGALWWYLSLAMASHGLLDALTNGGHGVAFLAPFSKERYFLPFRPVEVAPLSPHHLFSERGLAVLASEAVWIWAPVLAFGVLLGWIRGDASR